MSLTYTTWVDQIANMMVQDETDPNFVTFLPGCIDYAEQRMYRELDLLYTRAVDTSASLMTGSQQFTIPNNNGYIVVVEEIAAFTPAGSTSANGTRIPLVMVTKEFIHAAWPSQVSNQGVPQFFAPVSDTLYLVAPTPDANYATEVVGTIRPLPLSASNQTTWLTTHLPDAFFACTMIFATGYQRDFGAQTDNPPNATSWDEQYKTLMASANLEELRKKFMSAAWQPMAPSPVASPARV